MHRFAPNLTAGSPAKWRAPGVIWPVALLLLAAALAGCQSTRPASASFASVVITNRSVAEIRLAAEKAFRAEGYETFSGNGSEMVFEREGSRWDSLAYSGLLASQQGASAWIRVKAELVPLEPGSYRLQCQAYILTDHGDAFFQEEKKMGNFRSGPYQDILNKIRDSLKF
jgi:hypothetical protein